MNVIARMMKSSGFIGAFAIAYKKFFGLIGLIGLIGRQSFDSEEGNLFVQHSRFSAGCNITVASWGESGSICDYFCQSAFANIPS